MDAIGNTKLADLRLAECLLVHHHHVIILDLAECLVDDLGAISVGMPKSQAIPEIETLQSISGRHRDVVIATSNVLVCVQVMIMFS